MKQIFKRRLLKLAVFLESLPAQNFNLMSYARHEESCGTVACAIGWTPDAFPRLVKMEDEGNESYSELALRLFGMNYPEYVALFDNENPLFFGNPTPKIVARQIRSFAATGDIDSIR